LTGTRRRRSCFARRTSASAPSSSSRAGHEGPTLTSSLAQVRQRHRHVRHVREGAHPGLHRPHPVQGPRRASPLRLSKAQHEPLAQSVRPLLERLADSVLLVQQLDCYRYQRAELRTSDHRPGAPPRLAGRPRTSLLTDAVRPPLPQSTPSSAPAFAMSITPSAPPCASSSCRSSSRTRPTRRSTTSSRGSPSARRRARRRSRRRRMATRRGGTSRTARSRRRRSRPARATRPSPTRSRPTTT